MPDFFAFLNKYSVKKALKTRFSHPLGAVLGAVFALFSFVFKASMILFEILRTKIARANLFARAFLLYFKLNVLHLLIHEVVLKVRVHSTDKSF